MAGEGVFGRLHPGLQQVILANRWSGLSPIQTAAFDPILSGEDCVVEAPTAGGKTEAVLFPTLTRAAATRAETVQILYLAPLRALLNNLELRAERYAEACGLHVFKWHGDVAHQEKLEQLRAPPQLLLTTPESTEAILLRRAEWPRLFADLQCVIIDEAHNFAAGDRGGHLLSLLARLDQALDRRPQRIAVSATLGDGEAVRRWLTPADRPPARGIKVAEMQRVAPDFQVHFYAPSDGGDETPEPSPAQWLVGHLLRLLAGGRSLVFINSRSGAENLAKAIALAARGSPDAVRVRTHHSAVSKFYREEAERLIQTTREQGLNGIISTSTLELGIDIGELDRVIQVGPLSSSSSLLQRVGRTGRRPGRPRCFRGLCQREEELVLLVAVLRLALRGRSEEPKLPRRAFHLLAHQLFCLSLQRHGVAPEHAWEVLRHAHCYSAIRRDEFDRLVHHMMADGWLRAVDGLLVVGERAERTFLAANWRRLFAVFDSAPLYDVMEGKRQVGTLDATFVESLEVPFVFILGGRLWRAVAVDPKGHVVRVEVCNDGNAPRWQNFGGPDVPFETAQETGRVLHVDTEIPDYLDNDARERLAHARWGCAAISWRPGRLVIVGGGPGKLSLYSYAGDRINRTLARTLEAVGGGKATANYRRVEWSTPPQRADEQEAALGETLGRLRDGDWRDGDRLAHHLEGRQKLWPYSPFSRCLPEPLWASALVERTLDCGGLIRLLVDTEIVDIRQR